MANDATGGVVHRSKSIRDCLVVLIDLLVPSKTVSGWFDDSVADALRTVEAGSVKTGGRFSC
jgi:hypothetical protein